MGTGSSTLIQFRTGKKKRKVRKCKENTRRQDFFRLKNLILPPCVFLEGILEMGKWVGEQRSSESPGRWAFVWESQI